MDTVYLTNDFITGIPDAAAAVVYHGKRVFRCRDKESRGAGMRQIRNKTCHDNSIGVRHWFVYTTSHLHKLNTLTYLRVTTPRTLRV